MKKVFLAIAIAAVFAACSVKPMGDESATADTTAVDTTLVIDSVAVSGGEIVADSVAE